VIEIEFADVIWLNLSLYMGRAMAQVVSRRLYTTEARVRSQAEGGTVTRFSPSTPFSPLSALFHSCCVLIFICLLLLPEEQTVDAWELFNSNDVSEIGGRWISKHFYFLTLCRVRREQVLLIL
jgi:hypothetical protein